MNYSRRHFLCNIIQLAVAGTAFSIPSPVFAAAAKQAKARSLAFECVHTGKRLQVVYAIGNKYVPDSLKALNLFLRDHYSGAIGRMDPKLFDLLHHIKLTLGSNQPFEIVSGYRSPVTNTTLRKAGHRGVAKNSLHMHGKAVDLRIAKVSLADLRDAAVTSRVGGVGFYPRDHFVHVDTGDVRTW